MEFTYSKDATSRFCKFFVAPRLLIGTASLLALIFKGPDYIGAITSILHAVGVGS